MTGWEWAIWLILMIISYVVAPKPPRPADPAVQEGSVPTASANSSIPVLFGTKRIEQGNCVWWGDPRVEAIYTKGGKK